MDELVGDLLLWIPNHGHSSIGRPGRTYIDQLSNDVGMPVDDLKPAMEDRDVTSGGKECVWSGQSARFGKVSKGSNLFKEITEKEGIY